MRSAFCLSICPTSTRRDKLTVIVLCLQFFRDHRTGSKAASHSPRGRTPPTCCLLRDGKIIHESIDASRPLSPFKSRPARPRRSFSWAGELFPCFSRPPKKAFSTACTDGLLSARLLELLATFPLLSGGPSVPYSIGDPPCCPFPSSPHPRFHGGHVHRRDLCRVH